MKAHWKPGNVSIAILLACLTTILLTISAPDIGLTWDEPVYIQAAQSNTQWLGILARHPALALSAKTIDAYWAINHESPPVEKIWSGLVLYGARYFLDSLTAYRFGTILLVALLVALMYLMISETYGKAAGLFACAALICMPRFFFQAHLAALDVPVAVGSFALTFLFWKTVDRKSWAWGLLWGVVWGLTVATKVNGVFTLLALLVWFVIFRRTWSVLLRLLIMGVVAVFTFFIIWPWLYYQTWTRVLEYINFQMHHYNIGQWYLGQFYMPPPWHYVFVILWAVVPLTVMVLFLTGLLRAGKGKRDGGLAWLLIISAFISISPFIFGRILLYDGERLFMPVFPFLAALAGIGFGWLVTSMEKLLKRVKQPRLTIPVAFIIGMALLTPQVVSLLELYPHLLSYYSEGVGGLPGATQLGLETTYWNETLAAAIPYINTHAKPGDSIWVEDKAVFVYYQKIGRLDPDVWFLSKYPVSVPGKKGYGLFGEADWYVFTYRQSQYGPGGEKNYLPLQILETQTPVYQISYQGIPLMKVYGKLK
jgi:4-amino-4-deoxy-L-arabinose transferase-like glycosyltransferase